MDIGEKSKPQIRYPKTAVVDQVDDYHGTLVPDPYRWLEDTDSPETAAWIEAQNKLTFSYLEKIAVRPALRQRLTELWDFERRSAPFKKGGRYFQFRNDGLQNQDVLYVMDSYDGEARVLIDPNRFSEDGTVALTGLSVSEDGKLIAYGTSASGSDWTTWRVREVETGEDLPDLVEWSKFSGAAWLPDGSGFFYSRYRQPEPGEAYESVNYNQKLYFHKTGTLQSQDELVYERPDHKEWGFDARVTEDGRYLILTIWQGTDERNRLFYRDLKAGGDFVELISELEAAYKFIDNDGPVFYLLTNLDAPRSKLIAVNVEHPERESWRTVIPEAGNVLEWVKVINQRFVTLYLQDAHDVVRLYSMEGEFLKDIELPGIGSTTISYEPSITGNKTDTEMFYAFHSFVHPVTVFRYDFTTEETERIFFPKIAFDFDAYETQQVFVPGKDGVRIPMFLVHKRGIKLDGQNPTLLFGYGGFSVSLTPSFAIGRLVWLEMGGVLAVANLRGGGEYGEEWHQAGMIHNKQNVFDDFICCAEFLIADGITTTPRLAIEGRSNGGLLVGACLTQRPDLFGAALPAVGVMDMLRFHKFTIGWGWVSDYGCADDPEQFKTLYAYSPYHNIKPGTCYPPTLITTADHDDRVVPGHSFKFAAALQAAQSCGNPVLIRIQTKAGHGFGKPTAVVIEELADIYSFLVEVLKIEV